VTDLNNVNRASGGGTVENSREEIREGKVKNKDDINDIRKKIRESLKRNEKGTFLSLKMPPRAASERHRTTS